MNWIAVQPYYKVQREVSNNEQKTVVEDRLMYLYKDKMVTKHRQFAIGDVLDLSYKPIGGDIGLFYLHTRQGVFSYTVTANPQPFIEAYKRLIQLLSED